MNYTYKNIWLINFPVMMSILIEQLINITDAIFLGHVGEIELGASALAGIWYLAIYMLGFGFSLAYKSLSHAQRRAALSETGKTFFQGLFFLSGLAVFLCLFSKLFSPIILSRLIASAEVYHAVIDYLDGRIWGLLFSFPFLALRSFLVGITHTKALNVAALTAVLVNISGNWLLIFHWDMGIAGAAIASSFAEACSLAVLAIHVYVNGQTALWLVLELRQRCFAPCLPCVRLEYVPFVHRCSPLVSVLCGDRTFGRTATGSGKHSPKHFHPVLCHRQFICRHNRLIGKQFDWSGRKRQVFPLCSRVIRLGYAIGFPLIALALIFHQSVIDVYTDNPLSCRPHGCHL